MHAILTCPRCSQKLKVEGDLDGKQVQCPACKQVFGVRVPPPEQVSIAKTPQHKEDEATQQDRGQEQHAPKKVGRSRESRGDTDADRKEQSSRRGYTLPLVIGGGTGCLLLVLFVTGIVVYLVIRQNSIVAVKPPQPEPQQPKPAADAGHQPEPKAAGAREYKLGEQVRVGDLLISIPEVMSEKFFTGHYNGKFTPRQMMLVHVSIQNTSPGKIVEWPGWQGKGEVMDEHGNKFKSIDLTGWSCLPNNNTLGDGWNGDFATRIQPGTTYENAVYFDYAPPTSKQVVITLPLEGNSVTFRGLIGSKKKLDKDKEDAENEIARKKKAGMVQDASALFRDIKAASATIKEDYPTGCTIRVTGIASFKGDQTERRPDLKDEAYIFILDCENNGTAYCCTTDKTVYDKITASKVAGPMKPPVVGDKVTLQGTYKGFVLKGVKITLDIRNCVEVE